METNHRRTTQPRGRRVVTSQYTPVVTNADPEARPFGVQRLGADHDSQIAAGEPNSGSDLSDKVHDRKRSAGKVWLYIWWKPTAAALLVVAAVAAAIVTLYPYQDQPLPDWPLYITIGSLLSVYSVTLRSAATFLLADGLSILKWRWFVDKERPLYDLSLQDEATRGPLGAAFFLWSVRFRPTTWQWLGCILIPITLLTGPFMQQVLQYVPCNVLATSTLDASVPRASFFMSGGVARTINGGTLTLAEQAAVNAGLYDRRQIPATCSSGNCTLDPYTSIGYCATCDDLSSKVQVGINNGRTITFIPDGLSVNHSVFRTAYDGPVELAVFGQVGGVYRAMDPSFQIIIGLPGQPMDPATGKAPLGCADLATNQTWRCQGFGAASCSLKPCVRTYSTRVINGVLHESIVNEFDAFGDAWWHSAEILAALDLSCLDDNDINLLERAKFTLGGETDFIAYNWRHPDAHVISVARDVEEWALTQEERDMSDEMKAFENRTTSHGCFYAVRGLFHGALADYIDETFSGILTGVREMDDYVLNSATPITRMNGPQVLQTIYNYGNFSLEHTQSLFENISLSITHHMRMNPGDSGFETSSPGLGRVWTTKTCVNVQWVWLSLPGGVALLTLVFFGAAVVISSGLVRDVRTWKSSPLPYIFHGPTLANREDNVHLDDMEETSKTLVVHLDTDQDGIPTLREKRD